MIIKSLELSNFRNYESLHLDFSEGTNIFYGDNAQGKTNILESLYMISTTKSHRGVKDRDLIRFGQEEAHIRTVLIKNDLDYQVDMHLRMELCQLDASYLHDLNHYNKTVDQRNKLLKDIWQFPQLADTLDVWDDQLVSYGSRIIERRREFIEELAGIVGTIHERLSGGREKLVISYEPNCSAENLAEGLKDSRNKDIHLKMTSVGPHRDDFSFVGNGIDLRKFGSQGQQRTCALSLKLSEIELVTRLIGDKPVLMLDDVLSELDSRRQNYLMNTIGGIQTMITCTGLDEFVNNRFEIDQLYRIEDGQVVGG